MNQDNAGNVEIKCRAINEVGKGEESKKTISRLNAEACPAAAGGLVLIIVIVIIIVILLVALAFIWYRKMSV